MKTILLFLFAVTIASASFAQNPLVKQWDKRFGSDNNSFPGHMGCEFKGFIQATDGGFILVGDIPLRAGGDVTSDGCDTAYPANIWVVKCDSLGVIQWDKTFGSNGGALASGIVHSPGGGFYIAGVIDDIGCDVTGQSNGLTEYWLIRIDSLGNKIWDRNFGGSDFDYCRSVCYTSDGGCILAGYSKSPISGDKTEDNWWMSGTPDWWLIKIDSSGNLLWDQTIGTEWGESDINISATSDGGCYITGRPGGEYSGDFWFPLMDAGIWVLRLNTSGDIVLNKKLDGDSIDYSLAINNTSDGGCIILNYSLSGSGYDKTDPNHISGMDDLWLVKLNSNGDKQWDKVIGGAGMDTYCWYQHVEQTNDGGYFLTTGSSQSGFDKSQNFWAINGAWDTLHPWLIKTDSLGNIQWDKVIQVGNMSFDGNANEHIKAIECNDGSIAFANSNFAKAIGEKTDTAWKFDHSDYWMIKYDVQQCYSRFKLFVDSLQQHHYYIINHSQGDLPIQYTWDWGDGNSDTIPFPSHTYASAGIYTICLSIQDAGGCNATYCDSLQSILGPGNVPVTIDVIPQQNVGINEKSELSTQTVLYPNPASNRVGISSSSKIILVEIFNVIGENLTANSSSVNSKYAELEISNLSSGIYIVKVQTTSGTSIHKLQVRSNR